MRMRLRDYLEQNGLSLRTFAKRCGVSASTIHRVRNGKVTPNRRLMVTIVRETDGQVEPADLIGIFPDLDAQRAERDQGGNSQT